MLTTCQKRGVENLLPKLAMLHPQFAPLAMKDVLEESISQFNQNGQPTSISMSTGTGRQTIVITIEYFEIGNVQGVRTERKGGQTSYLHFSADKRPRL